MEFRNRKLVWGIAAALATLVLTGTGAALAAESLSAALPGGGGPWNVVAQVHVSQGAGTVFATRPVENGQEQEEFRVVFDDNTNEIIINGGCGGVFVPGLDYTVTASGYKSSGAWYVDIVVKDAQGLPVAVEFGVPMAGPPSAVTAAAGHVIDLDVE